jgi:hypothetical protein
LGRFLSVEAIIIGNYTVLSNTVKLTIKALDANTGFIIAASMKDIHLDNDAGALLGINVSSSGDANTNNSNRGFNHPLGSNEQYNNPETVNPECESKKIGDFCFENKTPIRLNVEIRERAHHQPFYLLLSPGQTQCFYNLKTKNYQYNIYKGRKTNDGNDYFYDRAYIIGKGEILVEKCKSKTFTIK